MTLPRPCSRLNGSWKGKEEEAWKEERWGRQGIGRGKGRGRRDKREE